MKNVQYFLALSSFMWLCSPVKNTNIVDNGEQLRSDKISSNSLSENHSKGEVSIVNRMLPASDGRDISAETSMQLMSASQEETRLANIENMLKMDIVERKMLVDKIDWLAEMASKKIDRLTKGTVAAGQKIDQLTEEDGAASKKTDQLKKIILDAEKMINQLTEADTASKKELAQLKYETEEKMNELLRILRKN